jgi:hypothetical protein
MLRSNRRRFKKDCTARSAATEPTNIARVFNDKPEIIMLAGVGNEESASEEDVYLWT